jgi:hypothetical protein
MGQYGHREAPVLALPCSGVIPSLCSTVVLFPIRPANARTARPRSDGWSARRFGRRSVEPQRWCGARTHMAASGGREDGAALHFRKPMSTDTIDRGWPSVGSGRCGIGRRRGMPSPRCAAGTRGLPRQVVTDPWTKSGPAPRSSPVPRIRDTGRFRSGGASVASQVGYL